MEHPITILRLVEHRQKMEKYSWRLRLFIVPLFGIVLIGSLMVLISSSKQGIDWCNGLTEETNDKTGGSEKLNFPLQGFIKTSGGAMNLSPFGRFKIVQDFPNVSPQGAPVGNAMINLRADLSYTEGVSLSLGGGEGTSTEGFGWTDDDFGLPPRDIKTALKHTNHIGFVGEFRYSDRLPRSAYPKIVVSNHTPYGPDLQFVPDSAFVFGWLYFQVNGWLRFDPLPDKNPAVSPRLQECLTDAVVKAYARMPCLPAIVDGQIEEQRFPCIIFFHEGEECVWATKPLTKVVMTKY